METFKLQIGRWMQLEGPLWSGWWWWWRWWWWQWWCLSYIDDFVVQIWNYQDGFTQLWLRTDGCRSHGEASEVGGFNPLSISSFVLDSSILSMGSTYISNISYLIHSRLCKYISTQSPSQEVDNCTWPAELRGCQSILLQSEKCHQKNIYIITGWVFVFLLFLRNFTKSTLIQGEKCHKNRYYHKVRNVTNFRMTKILRSFLPWVLWQ